MSARRGFAALLLLSCLALSACATEEGAGKASPEGAEAAQGLSVSECQSLCEGWNDRETATCLSDTPSSARCDTEAAARAAACASIVEGDCTEDVQKLFRKAAPAACAIEAATGSVCDGNTRVGVCSNGRKVRAECSDKDCPASAPKALGCRIEAGQARCDCGCDPDAPATCLGNNLKLCPYGELELHPCTNANCAEAGYGASIGCGLNTEDLQSCLCETL